MSDHVSCFHRRRSSGAIGVLDAATVCAFVFSLFTLLQVGALSERASAADRRLTPSEVESWFDHTLVDGLGRNLPVRPNVHVTEFIDGTDTFQAMNRRISRVSGPDSYIYLLNWWIDDTFPLVTNLPNTTLSKLLQKASDSRVEIRGMFWHQIVTPPGQVLKNASLAESVGRSWLG